MLQSICRQKVVKMSLDFKKREFNNEPVAKSDKTTGQGKESALSMLLANGQQDDEIDPKSPDTSSVRDENRHSPASPTGYSGLSSGLKGQPKSATKATNIPSSNRSTALPTNEGTGTPSSVRIPSSSYRKGSYAQSSLQQERNRAINADFPAYNTPGSSVLGTSAGYGHLFGAGEIGNVSSPRHYSVPVSKGFDPGSVEDRFKVNVPLTSASISKSSIPQNPSGSSSNLSAMLRRESNASDTASVASVNSVSRSLSKASLSRSNSKTSLSSFTSLKRFIEKPWKNDEYSPSSPDGDIQSLRGSGRSRKDSVASYTMGDEDFGSSPAVGSYGSGGSLPFTPGSVSSGDSISASLPTQPTANLAHLDQQYAAAQQQNGTGVRRRQSLKAFGKLGKTLGEGAGGHVKIIRSSQDNKIYAVKEFRARHHSESLREYNKKVGAEYCLGLTLKHPNVVNTLDIIYESDKVYQVMEYAAYDLFAIVMTGKMSREEVLCDFRQIMNGIRYLHHSGLAHRDLKLDNCVVSDQGIVKIIDFGSSVVFKYPESDKVYDCDGVVGSDPYLAPEAAGKNRYFPPATDIWSVAIVLCCMLMRKFPWKAPRMSDPAFKMFTNVEADGSRPGLDKLLSSLPDESHHLFRGMLDLNPETRFGIDQCWEDKFVDGPFCTIIDNKVVHAPGHVHTSVSFEEAHIALLEKKNRKAKKGEKMW